MIFLPPGFDKNAGKKEDAIAPSFLSYYREK